MSFASILKRVSLLILVLLGMGGGLSAEVDLIYPVCDKNGGGWEAVRMQAAAFAAGDGEALPYPSTHVDDFKDFNVKYAPPKLPSGKWGVYGLAIFSDDGCKVTVDGKVVHNRYKKGQALPRLEQSLHPLPVQLQPGQEANILINYSNVCFITNSNKPDIDGCALFVYLIPTAGLDAAIVAFQGDADDLAEDAQGVAAPHEMDPGSVVLAPVEGYPSQGTRSRLTLTVNNPLEDGQYSLKAVNLPNVQIFTSETGGQPLGEADLVWDVADFAQPKTLYVGAKTLTASQAAEVGEIVFKHEPSASSDAAASEDRVKITIEPVAVDAAIVRHQDASEDLPDDLVAGGADSDMDPGSIVISAVKKLQGGATTEIGGSRSRLTLDVKAPAGVGGDYRLELADLPNAVLYKNETGDELANATWTDADFEGEQKVQIYIGAKHMDSSEEVQEGSLTFTFTRKPLVAGGGASDGISYSVSDTVKVTIAPPVDLDIDSDNDQGFAFEQGTKDEDLIEASSDQPGKIVAVPIDPDADEDGVPDAADGFDGLGNTLGKTQFVPMVICLPSVYDAEVATITLSYTMSDPRGIADGSKQASSGFRIWTSDAATPRSTAALPADKPAQATGYFLASGEEISWSLLKTHCSSASGGYQGEAIVVYLETLIVGDDQGAVTSMPFSERESIKITASPGSESQYPVTEDEVNVGVRCTGGVQISGIKALMVNDDDDNCDGLPDKDDDKLGFLDDDVKQVTVKITTLDQPIKVTIDSKQLFTDLVPTPPGPGGLIDGVYPGLRLANGVAVGRDGDGQTESDADGQSKKGWKEGIYTIDVPANTTIVDNLYIEGLRRSTATDDVIITAAIEAPDVYAGNPEKCIATTKADHKLTVYGLDLDVDANGSVLDAYDGLKTYLPGYQGVDPQLHQGGKYKDASYKDAQDMRLYVVGATDGLEGEARMVESTSYKGYASNGMDDALQEGDPDFSLSKNGSADEVVSGQADATGLWFPLHCKDYGGWCKVKITLKKDGVVIDELIKSVPADSNGADSNGDKIADCWQRAEIDRWNAQYPGTAVIEKDKSGLDKWPIDSDAELADSDGSGLMPSMAGEGDGLKVIDEYRGFILDGGPNTSPCQHKRMSLARKELLVECSVEKNLTAVAKNGEGTNHAALSGFILSDAMADISAFYRDPDKGAEIDFYWVEDEMIQPGALVEYGLPEFPNRGAWEWHGAVQYRENSQAQGTVEVTGSGVPTRDYLWRNINRRDHDDFYSEGNLEKIHTVNRNASLPSFVKLLLPTRTGYLNGGLSVGGENTMPDPNVPRFLGESIEHSNAKPFGAYVCLAAVADEGISVYKGSLNRHFSEDEFNRLARRVIAHEVGHLIFGFTHTKPGDVAGDTLMDDSVLVSADRTIRDLACSKWHHEEIKMINLRNRHSDE